MANEASQRKALGMVLENELLQVMQSRPRLTTVFVAFHMPLNLAPMTGQKQGTSPFLLTSSARGCDDDIFLDNTCPAAKPVSRTPCYEREGIYICSRDLVRTIGVVVVLRCFVAEAHIHSARVDGP